VSRRRDLSQQQLPIEGINAVKSTLGLTQLDTDVGPAFMRSSQVPLSDSHGCVTLATLLSQDVDALSVLARNSSLPRVDWERVLFLDTETTGLSHGAGTVAFMIGTAQIQGDAVITRQYFLPSPALEYPMLYQLGLDLDGCDLVITFNGKSFDLPLLSSRYAMNRMASPLAGLQSFDLYHAARRVWRDATSDCRLTTLEGLQLGFCRKDDVSGYQIPSLYFKFVRTMDPNLIAPVFNHNYWDVLTMMGLLSQCLSRAAPTCSTCQLSPIESYNLARLHEAEANIPLAERLYRQALTGPLPSRLRRQTYRRLSMIYKRDGRIEGAKEIWKAQMSLGDASSLYAHIELAKVYEHRERRLLMAREAVETALAIARRAPAALRLARTIDDLEHRLARLNNKLEASPELA